MCRQNLFLLEERVTNYAWFCFINNCVPVTFYNETRYRPEQSMTSKAELCVCIATPVWEINSWVKSLSGDCFALPYQQFEEGNVQCSQSFESNPQLPHYRAYLETSKKLRNAHCTDRNRWTGKRDQSRSAQDSWYQNLIYSGSVA